MAAFDIFDMGLTRRGHHLLWGYKHGFGRGWLPYIVKRAIVHAWNPLACRVWGHKWFPAFETAAEEIIHDDTVEYRGVTTEVCSACSKERPYHEPL